ncbi:hypothetical protein AK812_SmicGene15745 [Symbiodinium microadriaticum]|uniref:Peptidase S74 domain-containing protein n=1 Tax=Symbiodinium microadriaticum TaxID=2951 RepID=A0A1Q9E230_SYMMI|nr:hypothetical protein AK812_SmicGene15745 [Symbiodinium microadriaticum]
MQLFFSLDREGLGSPCRHHPTGKLRRTSGRTQTEIDDAVAGLLDQATADTRYFVRAPGAESGSPTVQEQFTPRIVRNLLLEASLCRATPSSETKARCASAAAASWTKVEADSDARFLPTTWAPWTAGQQRAVFGADGHGGVLDLQGGAGVEPLRRLAEHIPDITVRSDRTLNATTADFVQFFVASAEKLRVIFGYGHLNASDRRLKTNIRRVPDQHVQRLFDAVEPQYYDRIGGGKDQLGFIAQDVQAAGKLGETLCKTMMSGEEELYQKLSVVLWGVVKGLQKRVDKLEKKRGRLD